MPNIWPKSYSIATTVTTMYHFNVIKPQLISIHEMVSNWPRHFMLFTFTGKIIIICILIIGNNNNGNKY